MEGGNGLAAFLPPSEELERLRPGSGQWVDERRALTLEDMALARGIDFRERLLDAYELAVSKHNHSVAKEIVWWALDRIVPKPKPADVATSVRPSVVEFGEVEGPGDDVVDDEPP